MKFQKTEKDFLVFENLGKLSWIIGLEIIWNIHRKSLRQKGTDQLTSARGKFGLWKMAEKIRTCGRKKINGGHNVSPNMTNLDISLMSGDVTSSYNGGVGSSSNNVFTDNARIFG